MKKLGVAILGLGVVGGGTYKILTDNREYYRRTQKLDVTVECVLEKNKQRALDLGVEEEKIASSIEEVISNPNVDVVVEVIGGTEPARSFVLQALMLSFAISLNCQRLFARLRNKWIGYLLCYHAEPSQSKQVDYFSYKKSSTNPLGLRAFAVQKVSPYTW